MAYNPKEPWSQHIHKTFCAEVVALLDAIDLDAVPVDAMCDTLVKYIDTELEACGGIDNATAKRSFARMIDYVRSHPDECAQEQMLSGQPYSPKEAIAMRITHYAEEVATDVRWPIAFAYIVTGKVPDHYASNTTVTVVAVDENLRILGHEVIDWSNFAAIEDDAQRYREFHNAITDAAIRLDARSFYEFVCDGRPSKRMAIAYAPDGPIISREHSYRHEASDN